MDLIETFAGTIWIGAITMAYVTTILHKGEEWWGYINTSYYVGTLIGGLLAWKMSSYIQNNLIRSMSISSLIFSILTFFIWYDEQWIYCAFSMCSNGTMLSN